MKVFKTVVGNTGDAEWKERLKSADIDSIELDQWSAQKSRFTASGSSGTEYAVALERNAHISDGDILEYSPEQNRAVVVRLRLNDVLVVDMNPLRDRGFGEAVNTALELGHAIGNQHWPAVVKDTKVYIPLTVDRKVMLSVMQTHDIKGIAYSFRTGRQVIPYLSPNEVRRLFGGSGHHNHSHSHANEYA